MDPRLIFLNLNDSDSETELPRKPPTATPKPRVFMQNAESTTGWSRPNSTFYRRPQQPSMSVPRERLIRKEFVLNMFINESVKQLLGVFGNSVHRLSLWLLDRGNALSHHCGRCGRRAGKYCQIASAPVVGHTHRYRVCRKCCGCSFGSKNDE